VNFLPLNPIRKEEVNIAQTTPPLEIQSDNKPKSNIAGYGLVAQLALTERFALTIHPSIRKADYTATTHLLEGTDNPNTIADERRGTNIDEDTRARFLDVPVLLRFYGRPRQEEGHRWFAELGPSLRWVRRVRTHRDILRPDQSRASNDTPVDFRKRVTGATAGFGGQFIDPYGVRVVPEVRYTRWLNGAFGNVSGRSRRHQVEIILSLTF